MARIYTEAVTTRLAKSLWTAWSGEHAGGQLVARGYTKARGLLRTRKGDSASKRLSGGASAKQALSSAKDAVQPKKSLDASGEGTKDGEEEKETSSPHPGAAEGESSTPAGPEAEAAEAKPAAPASPIVDGFMKSVTARIGTWSAASGAVAAAQLSASGVLPSVMTKRQREAAEEDTSKASTGLNADALSPAQQQKAEEKAGEGATEADVQAAAAANETDDEGHDEKEDFGKDSEDCTHLGE